MGSFRQSGEKKEKEVEGRVRTRGVLRRSRGGILRPQDLDAFSSSSTCSRPLFIERLKFEIPSPRPRPIWGRRLAPNRTITITRMMTSSGTPIPPIRSTYLPPRLMIRRRLPGCQTGQRCLVRGSPASGRCRVRTIEEETGAAQNSRIQKSESRRGARPGVDQRQRADGHFGVRAPGLADGHSVPFVVSSIRP